VSRFLYWTILIGDEPTSFRAAEAAELKPTLVQLQRTNPDARLVWFERGRIWASPAEAQAARLGERATSRARPSTWRPGGKHVDPRQKYKDAKKAKWTRFKEGIRQRAEGRHGDRPPPVREDGPKRTTKEILADWKPPPKGAGEQPQKTQTFKGPQNPPKTQTFKSDRDEPRRFESKPEGDRAGGDRPWRPKPDRLRADSRRPWGANREGDRPAPRKPWGSKPEGDRPARQPWGSKPAGERSDTRRPWGAKPHGDRPAPRKPWGSKPDAQRSESRRPPGPRPDGARPDRPKFGGKPGAKFARPKFDGPRPPRPRTRDDRGPRKPRKD
jgi:hypothetical protein